MVHPLSALPAATRLEEYEIRAVLGVGGFGITYLGHDTLLHRPVAIKEYLPNALAVRATDATVHPKSEADQEQYRWGLDRFLQEARILARFNHPNIVRVLRVFEAHGTAYLVMDFEAGQSLADHLAALPPGPSLNQTQLLGIFLPLLDGLRAVHSAGFLHRDIKPANILLRPDGTPVLLDFGSARQALGGHTQSLTAVVTPRYAPLEQYYAEGKQGPWSDLYALGAVLYRCVTGAPPPDAVQRAREDTLIPARVAGQGRYDDSFLAAIDYALAVDERARPQDVDTLRQFLLAEMPTQPLTVPTPGARPAIPTAPSSQSPATAPDPGPTTRAPTTRAPTARTSTPPPAPTTLPGSPPASRPWRRYALGGALGLLSLLLLGTGASYLKHRKAHPASANPSAVQPSAPPSPPTDPTPLPQEGGGAPLREAITHKAIEHRFIRADTNGDGFLSREEAATEFTGIARHFDDADLNHDGRLSLPEVVYALEKKRQLDPAARTGGGKTP